MKRLLTKKQFESGQVIPIVVLMLVAIIAMVALILDGGSVMSNRRSAQAAADAGAMAGAKLLCSGQTTGVTQTAEDYAKINNKATTAVATLVEVTLNNKKSGGVNVKTSVTNSSFFARIFGVNNLTASAEATAGCFSISKARVLPIAWSCKKSANEALSDSKDCVVHMLTENEWTALKGTSGSVTLRRGTTVNLPFDPLAKAIPGYIYVVMDSAKLPNDVSNVCADPSQVYDPSTGLIDCDINNDGVNDVLGGGDRSWLDLDSTLSDASTDTGNGAATLKRWITNPATVPPLATHTWLGGQTGVANSIFRTVDSVKGTIFKIPVYNYICPFGDVPENHLECIAGAHAGDTSNPVDLITKNSPGASNYFHIAGFSALYITCVDDGSGKNKCPGAIAFIEANKWNVNNTHLKTIEGYFIEGYNFDDADPGTGGVDVGVHIVSLTK